MSDLGARTKGATWSIAPQTVLDYLTEKADSLGRVDVNQCAIARYYGTSDQVIHRILNRLRELNHLRPLNPEEERPRWHVITDKAKIKPAPRKIIIWE